MFQTDQPTAVSAIPSPATPGTQGFFTNGNPASGVPATIVDADWLNMVQQELVNVVLAAGIPLSKTTYSQVLAAIKRIGQNTVVLADTGAANAYAAANSTPLVAGTWTDGVVQQVKIAHANTGASTYAPDGLTAIPIYGLGLQPLQGGELFLGGTAVLMHATIAGVNGGNPICVLMECAGGAQQVAPATQSQHAAQFGQVSGVVGQARNLTMSVSAASASATLMADEIVVETALGGLRYCLANFNKTINLATTGAGGMDTGTAPASGFVALYAIYNQTTGASALLATNATGAFAPNVYGGANMPAGYTASALVSVWPTNSSRQFIVGYQNDRKITINSVNSLTGTTAISTLTALSISAVVPINAKSISGWMGISSSGTASILSIYIAASSVGLGQKPVQGNNTAAVNSSFGDLVLATPQTVYYYNSCVGSTISAQTIQITDYTF